MSQQLSEKITTLKRKIEPTLIAILMAEHPRLGHNAAIPTDVTMLIAGFVHKDVSKKLINQYLLVFH